MLGKRMTSYLSVDTQEAMNNMLNTMEALAVTGSKGVDGYPVKLNNR